MNREVYGQLIMVDYPNRNPVLNTEGDVYDHLTPIWRLPRAVPFPLTEEDTQEQAHLASFEHMERFHFYCAMLQHLVLIGTIIPPPVGKHAPPNGYIQAYPVVPTGPERFRLVPFPILPFVTDSIGLCFRIGLFLLMNVIGTCGLSNINMISM
jgi:hypothetical protein